MKEPQVGVLCPEIRELDGDFGDELGWSFFLVGHDAWMYHLMFKVGGHQYRVQNNSLYRDHTCRCKIFNNSNKSLDILKI